MGSGEQGVRHLVPALENSQHSKGPGETNRPLHSDGDVGALQGSRSQDAGQPGCAGEAACEGMPGEWLAVGCKLGEILFYAERSQRGHGLLGNTSRSVWLRVKCE